MTVPQDLFAATGKATPLPCAGFASWVWVTFAPVPDDVLEEIVDTVFLPLVR
ncbi:hypothetical protein ACQEVY_19180 [Streptomyces sp. CA-288835]|uniref:hypothetical protein n=1 Tax=Streptomyces sp. CA-288835 TaxID=3240069 RepID=UPI003D8BD6E1